ncbi:hypothetical protein EMIT0P12_10202 [Pseudomonas sp. IT-P12]
MMDRWERAWSYRRTAAMGQAAAPKLETAPVRYNPIFAIATDVQPNGTVMIGNTEAVHPYR